MIEQLQISKSDYHRVLNHLMALHPLEGCGLMAGRQGNVELIYVITNLLKSQVAFEMNPAEQLAAMLDIEDRGLELLAIYHSHPNGPPTPSAVDMDKNYFPDAVQVIVSWLDPNHPMIKAFRIDKEEAIEIPLLIN